MSQADSLQWQQYDADIREGNRLAYRTAKEWQAAKSDEADVFAGRPQMRVEEEGS